jgi:hypothetical protein
MPAKKKTAKRRKTSKTTAAQVTNPVETENTIQTRGASKANGHVKGGFELMIEFPLDILHEVFRELDPVDLVHLSWTSKSFRRVVMDKSASYLWEEVGKE